MVVNVDDNDVWIVVVVLPMTLPAGTAPFPQPLV